MLVIKNKEGILSLNINVNTQREYFIEGMYEYPNFYQIHLRSYDVTMVDEVLILTRNRKEDTENGIYYKYYEMYDSNRPEHMVGLTKEAIQNKDTIQKAIIDILSNDE